MSESASQKELYKDKALYAVLNILLAKIQRLEVEVVKLKSERNNRNEKKTIEKLQKKIDLLELKLNNKTVENKRNKDNLTITSALDEYLNNINDVVDFNIDNTEIAQLNDKKDE